MENCLRDGVVLVEAPKFARLLRESGILKFRDWAGSRRVLDAVRTLRLMVDIVFSLCFGINEDELTFHIKKSKGTRFVSLEIMRLLDCSLPVLYLGITACHRSLTIPPSPRIYKSFSLASVNSGLS